MSKRSLNQLWVIGITCLSCLGAILGALALGYAFDFSTGQFNSFAPLWILTLVLGAVTALAAGLYPIFALKNEVYSPDYKISPFMDFASLFAASMLVLDAVSTHLRNRNPAQNLLTIKAILAVAAALFFVALFTKRALGTPIMTGLAALTTLWAVFEAFHTFLSPTFSMTSPFRTFPQLPCLALALFMLTEAKVSSRDARGVSEGEPKKKIVSARLLIGFAAFGGTLSILIGGAIVLAYVFHLNRAGMPATDAVWLVALGIYALGRTKQILLPK